MAPMVGAARGLAEAKKLVIGEDHQLDRRGLPTGCLVRCPDFQRTGRERRRNGVLIPASVLPGEDVRVFEQLGQPLDLVSSNRNAPTARQ